MVWSVQTDSPVAFDSPDHFQPNGCLYEEPGGEAFVALVGETLGKPLRVLDLGAGAGRLVSLFLAAGHDALGLEGSDAPRLAGKEAWACHPGNLLTCDISRPFRVLKDGTPATFDLACAFEVLEHIPEDRLPALLSSLHFHLKEGGLLLATIPSTYDPPWHVTVRFRGWWEKFFGRYGFEKDEGGLSLLLRERPRGEPGTVYAYRRAGDDVQRRDGLPDCV